MSLRAGSKTASRRRSADTAAGPKGDDWSQSVTRRAAGPPLRFKGRVLARQSDSVAGDACSITLWQRKTRGFVTAVDAGPIVDSISTESLDAAMTWLEDLCRKQVPCGAHTPIAALMRHTPTEAAAFRSLRVLAGQMLDQLDHASEPGR